MYRGAEQRDRNATAAAVIVQIEDLKTPETTKLSSELRRSFVNPSAKDIARLQKLYPLLKSDPKSAEQYTVEAKQAELHKLSATVQPLFGDVDDSADVKPGID
jgi:hypothetical protein